MAFSTKAVHRQGPLDHRTSSARHDKRELNERAELLLHAPRSKQGQPPPQPRCNRSQMTDVSPAWFMV